MHLSHIPQYTIQNRNVHISVLNGVLWDVGQVPNEICVLKSKGFQFFSLILDSSVGLSTSI